MERKAQVKENIKVLISEEEMDKKIRALGAQISKDYEGRQVHMIGVLKGASFFMCELAKRITVPVSIDFMAVSSYGSSTKSSGIVRIVKDLDEPLMDKDVLVVEDIVDSGVTLNYLKGMLQHRGAASICIVTLLDKPERRRVKDLKVDYSCFNIPDEFVVGYGLDYDQAYRNLPDIGVLSPKVYEKR
jgi:hypoxanthine phosphoribosyltransferase